MKPDDAGSGEPDESRGAFLSAGESRPLMWESNRSPERPVAWPRWLRLLGLASVAFGISFTASVVGGFAAGFLRGFARSHGASAAPEVAFLLTQAGVYGVFAGAALFFFARESPDARRGAFGWTLVEFDLRLVALIVAAQALCGLWVVLVTILLGPWPRPAPAQGASDPWLRFVVFLVFMLVAPILEEVFFRGWLQARARRLLPALGAVVFTAILFASAHYDGTLRKPVAILALGMTTGWLRQRSGSLLPGVALHVANNTLALGLGLLVR